MKKQLIKTECCSCVLRQRTSWSFDPKKSIFTAINISIDYDVYMMQREKRNKILQNRTRTKNASQR